MWARVFHRWIRLRWTVIRLVWALRDIGAADRYGAGMQLGTGVLRWL